MLINQSVIRLLPYRLRKILNVHTRVNLAGQEMTIPVRVDDAYQNLSWSRAWRAEIFERLAYATKNGFVDVGANVGQTLLDFHLTNPGASYVGFEPNISCVNYLKDMIRANSLENYLLVPVGLADENKILPFYLNADAPTDQCGTIVSDLRPGRVFDVDFVPCFKFDDVRQELKLPQVGFIKIDVEGAELETLTGMRASLREFRPLVLCEVLFTDSKSELSATEVKNERLMRLLADLDYKVFQIIKSADNVHVAEMKEIAAFPSAYWTEENKDLCDYLFVPAEEEARVQEKLFGVS